MAMPRPPAPPEIQAESAMRPPGPQRYTRTMSDAEKLRHYVDKRPDFEILYKRIVRLYYEITSKALENEQGS